MMTAIKLIGKFFVIHLAFIAVYAIVASLTTCVIWWFEVLFGQPEGLIAIKFLNYVETTGPLFAIYFRISLILAISTATILTYEGESP